MTDSPVDQRDTTRLPSPHHTSIAFMIYGRVVGNELRDIPPECLPIWGQRWSGYRAPHGPSPFSTRIFSVDQMSEMGPALTSPTQFEVMLTEEDEVEDASSGSSRLYNSLPLSPLAIRTDVTEPTFRPEPPTPRSVHHSSNHPHGNPKILHRSTGYPPLENATCLSTTLLLRRQSEQPGIQPHASEPLLRFPSLHHGISIQGDHSSSEGGYALWDIDSTSTNIQPRAVPSHRNHDPSRQLQHTIPPYLVPEWQFTQPNASPHLGGDHLLRPFRADDGTRFIIPTPPSSSHSFTTPFPRQNDPSWSHEPSITMISGIAHPQHPTISQWPSGPVPPYPSFPRNSQNPGSSLGPGAFYHLVPDCHRYPSHPDLLDTLAHPEGSILFSLDKPGDDQL